MGFLNLGVASVFFTTLRVNKREMIRTEGSEIRLATDHDGIRRYRNDQRQLHRPDGPAVEWPDGTCFWYLDGQPHRDDGPAVEWADGGQEWWRHSERHRVGGPANIRPDGRRWWYLDGQPVTEEEAVAGKRLDRETTGPIRRTATRLW